MGISGWQLDFFGDSKPIHNGLRFCIKKHWAITAKLHYDLRLQFDDITLKSFAVKPEISMNPEIIANADLVDDHEMNTFRREGTILKGIGQGYVLHFDEGYFTIPGIHGLKESRKGIENGLAIGSINILFEGYKIKGEFTLKRKPGSDMSKWIIQKIDDQFSNKKDNEVWDNSILSGKKIEEYKELYNKQMNILENLNPDETSEFIKRNNGESFKYKKDAPIKI